MYARKLTIAEFKAWSQSLGHEGAMTTLTSYGKLSIEEQGELVRGTQRNVAGKDELLDDALEIARLLRSRRQK